MSERIVFLNGEFLPESRANVSILDRGFLYGDSVYDAARTFNGQPWRLREHISRLYLSCRYARLNPEYTIEEMEDLTLELIEKNKEIYPSRQEFRIQHWVTRGTSISYSPSSSKSPNTTVIFTLPMDYERFAKGYVEGVPSIISSVRRIPPECVDPRAKVGNKMNHIQSEFQAAQAGGWAIMLDVNGLVAEGPSYNCFFIRDGVLLTSREHNCLHGVNLQYVFELAKELGIQVERKDLTQYDLVNADEAFHTGNSICILPVSSIDGVELKHGAPGPITKKLMELWFRQVECNWAEKAIEGLPSS